MKLSFVIFLTVLAKYFIFYTPDFDGTYYGIASSVCLSVYLSVCPGIVGRTVSCRILQLGTVDKHYVREVAISFKIGDQRSRSNCHIVGKRCKQDTE